MKFLFKKYLYLSLLFVGLIIGFFRCVAIEDLIAPTIGDFVLEERYNITDSILVTVNLFDNFVVEKADITIKKVGGNSSLDTTITISTDSTQARLVNLVDYPIFIPVDAALGEYTFTLTVADGIEDENNPPPNITTIEKTFFVDGDGSAPLVDGIELDLDLDINIDNLLISAFPDGVTYQACRSSIIPISGTASDNVGIESILAEFRTEQGTSIVSSRREFTFSGETKPLQIVLEDVFETNPIVVPSQGNPPNNNFIANNTQLELVIVATDINGQSASKAIPFMIDCDDQSPIIQSIITNPPLNETNGDSVKVIQGQELFITGGIVSDKRETTSIENDGLLKNISVYFNNEDAPFKTWFINSDTINLKNLDSIPLAIPIPPNPQTTDNYSFTVEATDFAGNEPTRETIRIKIIENEPPNLSSVQFTFGDADIIRNFSNNPREEESISVDITYRLVKGITDESGLSNYIATWQREQEAPITIGELSNINSNDIQFVSSGNDDAFTKQYVPFAVEEGTRVGTRYTLTIQAEDTSGKFIEQTYYFIVTE
ncbi:hypothetical protein WAF17_04655 [Bernardetia sp. ABR2-2B]|uniref:hypothetical protein n=1 Tax=Bernardetia sp. ABR2-2B TaxID=3127472 RepID=UPI0030CCFC35